MEFNTILDSDLNNEHNLIKAGFGIRLGASLLDGLILIPITLLNLYAVYFEKSYILYVIAVALAFLYKPIMEGLFGATLGKMICKIMVVNIDGSRIDNSKAFVRSILWLFVSITGVFEILPLFGNEKYQLLNGFQELSLLQSEVVEPKMSLAAQLILLISGLMIALKPKRGIHDYASGTQVVFSKKG